jgi:beta-glucanase (GH16 family)
MLGTGLAKAGSAQGPRAEPGSRLIWSDEFQGRAGSRPDPRRWVHMLGGHGWGNSELQQYTDRPANASLDGKGHLAISARPENFTGPDGITRGFTSARLTTQNRLEFAYGVAAARIRVPAGNGLLPAFWALGSNVDDVGWPASGEIDIMEVLGSAPSALIGTIHGPQPGTPGFAISTTRPTLRPLSDGFHVYSVYWTPGRIAFAVDDIVYAERRPSDLPPGATWAHDHPFFLLLTLAVGGDWPGPPDSSTGWPATMSVDWVRVWQRNATFCRALLRPQPAHPCPKRARRAAPAVEPPPSR